jgi:hypothetical protein
VQYSRVPVDFWLPARFPFLANKALDTYLLPDTTDLAEFCQYLLSKNKVGWRGARVRASRDAHAEQLQVLATAATRGGIVAVSYAFAALFLGIFNPLLLPFLGWGAWGALGLGLTTSGAAWKKARKVARQLHLTLAEHTSWRLINFAKDQTLAETAGRELGGAHARQFLAELDPEKVRAASLSLIGAGVFDDNHAAEALLGTAANEAAVLCPAPGSSLQRKKPAKKDFQVDPNFDDDFD